MNTLEKINTAAALITGFVLLLGLPALWLAITLL
jgi:hypothetical protein